MANEHDHRPPSAPQWAATRGSRRLRKGNLGAGGVGRGVGLGPSQVELDAQCTGMPRYRPRHQWAIPVQLPAAAAEQPVPNVQPATKCPVLLSTAVGKSAFRRLEVISFGLAL